MSRPKLAKLMYELGRFSQMQEMYHARESTRDLLIVGNRMRE